MTSIVTLKKKLPFRAAALSNSARRGLWLKSWKADISKEKLCAIPCSGGFFGFFLNDLLEKQGLINY